MLTNRQLFQQYLGLPSVVNDPIEIVRAAGIYLYDDKGHQYVDLVSGVAVSNTGHLHPHVVNAIKSQLDKYMHTMVYGKFVQAPQVQLAQKLSDLLPDNLQSIYFVNSGSEAVEGALKLAKRLSGRPEMISFKNSYHGGTAGALSMLGHEGLKQAFRPLLPAVKHLEFNNFEQLNIINQQAACVLVEPIQAEAGIILPQPGFLQALRKRCNETGTLLIFDEIQMGFGRTGTLFAFQQLDVIPDILCMAKAMGGGLPLGAFAASKQMMNAFTFQPELGHITTFGGHPVSCAASLASLEVLINEKLIEQADAKGKAFEDILQNVRMIKEIRRKGLMLGIELEPEIPIEKLLKHLQKHKLIVDQFLFHAHAFRIAPPLTISHDEINKVSAMILEALNTFKY
ncbi:MAG: aspartate aminotransferase family protein [Bacteroidales bacterium]|nr:aspartate aminotransferase family protein [Bacteroidales bacterium]MDN5349272.1 acetylornithine/N-succinyldiaminopimelate aminotransferase [Bacteroidales bacterium]